MSPTGLAGCVYTPTRLKHFKFKNRQMTNKQLSLKKNFKKNICTWVIFSIVCCFTAGAQTQPVAEAQKTDSLYKANQLKMYNDSLEAVTKKAANTGTQTTVHQPVDTRPISQRIGFNMSTSFWVNVSKTFFEFAPVVVYSFPKIISIGVGPTYIYNRDRINKINLHGWGGKVFSRAQLTNWFYAYTEYQGIDNQYISGIDLANNKITKSSEYVNSWFLSLGVNIRVGKRHGINMQALYDVLYNKNTSPYYGAWTYRIGFGF
jgi:hypothetical protein